MKEVLKVNTVTETTFEFDPSLPSADNFKFDANKRNEANYAYENSRTGPHTILPCSIAYCPMDKVIPREMVANLRIEQGKSPKRQESLEMKCSLGNLTRADISARLSISLT